MSSCSCHELVFWRGLALSLLGVVVLFLGVRFAVFLREVRLSRSPLFEEYAQSSSPLRQLFLPVHQQAGNEDFDVGDSFSDASSLFSPPAKPGLEYRTAAANVSETHLLPSVSTEGLDRMLARYSSGEDLEGEELAAQPKTR